MFLTAVYTPPHANAKLALAKLALAKLHDPTYNLQKSHPDAVFILAGDFIHTKLKIVLPEFFQFVDFPPRGNKIVDPIYRNVANAYHVSYSLPSLRV